MSASLKKTATLSNLREMVGLVRDFATKQELPEEAAGDFALAVEELLVNIVNYASSDPARPAEIEINLSSDTRKNTVTATISDNGIPFDPTAVGNPDLDEPAEKRDDGGMGIYLVKNLTDEFLYRHENSRNIVTVSKKKN